MQRNGAEVGDYHYYARCVRPVPGTTPGDYKALAPVLLIKILILPHTTIVLHTSRSVQYRGSGSGSFYVAAPLAHAVRLDRVHLYREWRSQ